MPADTAHRASDGVLGGAHDFQRSPSSCSGDTCGDATAASLSFIERVAAAAQGDPRYLRCHEMTRLLPTSGESPVCEESPSLGEASRLDVAAITTTSSDIHLPDNTISSVSLLGAESLPTSPSLLPLQAFEQRAVKKPRCVRRANLLYLEQMQRRCRTATVLIQHCVESSRSPGAEGNALESLPQTAVIVMRQPCGSLSAPLSSPYPFSGGDAAVTSTCKLHSTMVKLVSTETRPRNWSTQGRVRAVTGSSRGVDAQECSSDDKTVFPNKDGVLQPGYDRHGLSGVRIGLRERGDGSDQGRSEHDTDMGAGDSAAHRWIPSTAPHTTAPSSSSSTVDVSVLSVEDPATGICEGPPSGLDRDTHRLLSHVRPSTKPCSPQTVQQEGTGMCYHPSVGHTSVRRSPSRATPALAQSAMRSIDDAAAAQHGWPHPPLSVHGDGLCPTRSSPSREIPASRLCSLVSSTFTAVETPLAQSLTSARPAVSPTSSRQHLHRSLFTAPPALAGLSSGVCMAAATNRAPAAGVGRASRSGLVFTAMEPASVGIDSIGSRANRYEGVQPVSLLSLGCHTSSGVAHGDCFGEVSACVPMFQQHLFSSRRMNSSGVIASLPSSRAAAARSTEGDPHRRIASAGTAAPTAQVVRGTAVVGSNRHRDAHDPCSESLERVMTEPSVTGSVSTLLSRITISQHHRTTVPLAEAGRSLPSETLSHRPHVGPHTRRDCCNGDSEEAWDRTTKEAKEMLVMPSTDTSVLLLVPGGVSSVPAAVLSSMTSAADGELTGCSGAPIDAAFALSEDIMERVSCEAEQVVVDDCQTCIRDGDAVFTEPAMGRTVTYFPLHKSVVAQGSAYFAGLLNHGGGCGPYVHSTPDEYVDLTDLSTASAVGAFPAEIQKGAFGRTGDAAVTHPWTGKSSHFFERRVRLSRNAAVDKSISGALHDAEPAPPAGMASHQPVPVYYIPTPATIAYFIDAGDGDPVVSCPPKLTADTVCQVLHYLYTGVLPMFFHISGTTGLSEQGPTAVAEIDGLQHEAPHRHVAQDYAAVLWLGLFTGLSSLTSSLLTLLSFFLALSRDVWSYWTAAVQWRLPEMQSICESWMRQYLCVMLRASTAQGMWRGMRLDHVQLLVTLRREALEVQLRVAETKTVAGGGAAPCSSALVSTVGGSAAGTSMTSTINAEAPLNRRGHTGNGKSAPRFAYNRLLSEGISAYCHAQSTLRPPAFHLAAIGWSAEMLRHHQPHLQLPSGASSTTTTDVGVETRASFWSATPHISSLHDPRHCSATAVFPYLGHPAVEAHPTPTQDDGSHVSSRRLPSPCVGASFPAEAAASTSVLLTRDSSRAEAPCFPSRPSPAVLHFWSHSGRPTATGTIPGTSAQGQPSSAALVFDNVGEMAGTPVVGYTNDLAAATSRAQGHQMSFGPREEGVASARLATASSLGSFVHQQTLPPTGIPLHESTDVFRIVHQRSGSATEGSYGVFRGPHAQRRPPYSRPDTTKTTTKSTDYAAPPSITAVTRPALRLLEDGSWDIGGCGRLYTTVTREELEQLQVYWSSAEREQQRKHPSGMLLTDHEMLDRLWTWWHARTDDDSHPTTEAEMRAMAEMLQSIHHDLTQYALPTVSKPDNVACEREQGSPHTRSDANASK